jgi:eukaryotic-like serine/threonine-protein kinase
VPGFPRAEERSLVFMDRQGRATPVTSTKRAFFFPSVSPDGGRLAVGIAGVDDNLWVLDLSSDTLERVTFEGDMGGTRWGPDGRRLFFSSNLKGARGLFAVAAEGSGRPEQLFLHPEWWINTFSPHPGGAGVLLSTQKADGHDLLLVREGGGDPEPFLATTANEQQPAFSPDGRVVAYVSDESGRYQVYLRPFPGPGRKRQVSVIDGIDPRWRRDGRELFFFEGVRLMAVAVEPGPEPRLSKPVPLFEVSPEALALGYDVMPDGQRFVMLKPGAAADAPLQLVVVPGFLQEMQAHLAGKR